MMRAIGLALCAFFGLIALVRAETLTALELTGQNRIDNSVLNTPIVMYCMAMILLTVPLIRIMQAVERINDER